MREMKTIISGVVVAGVGDGGGGGGGDDDGGRRGQDGRRADTVQYY